MSDDSISAIHPYSSRWQCLIHSDVVIFHSYGGRPSVSDQNFDVEDVKNDSFENRVGIMMLNVLGK